MQTEEPPTHGQSQIEKIVSGTALMVRPWSQSAEIAVRPDCKEESILSLVEQVLFSLGGRMGKRYPEDADAHNLPPGSVVYSPLLMVAATNENLIWNEITVILGVNRELQRVVFINIGSSKSMHYTLKQISDLAAFCTELFDHIYTALSSNGMVWTHSTELTALTDHMPDGVIDLEFIRDLQSAISQNMNERLLDEVNKIDEAMKAYELKCARLMTLLKPTYLRASLNLPSAPEKVSLSTYPLKLKRKLSIRDINAEQCRLSLLRARRNFKEFYQGRLNASSERRFDEVQIGNHTFSSEDYDKYGFQVFFVVNDLHQQILQWSAEEYGVRIQRKIQSAKDRYESLRRFKIQLLLTLHDRFTSSVANNASLLQSWGFSTLSADKKFQNSVQEKFNFLDDSQPLLVDATGQIDGKKGSIFLTLSHIFSYSANTILGGLPTLLVIPCTSIKSLELVVNGRLLSSVLYPAPSKDPISPSKARVVSKGPEISSGEVDISALLGTYILRIRDFADSVHEMIFFESTTDFAVRIFDMLDFIVKVHISHILFYLTFQLHSYFCWSLKERLYSVAEYQPSQRRQMEQTESTTIESSLEDLGDMLEITFEKGGSDSSSQLSAAPASEIVPIVENISNQLEMNLTANNRQSTQNETPLIDFDYYDASVYGETSISNVEKKAVYDDIFSSMTFSMSSTNISSQNLPEKDVPSPNVPVVDSASPSAASITAAPAPAAPQPNKRLASNIQKFLQQSQQKSS